MLSKFLLIIALVTSCMGDDLKDDYSGGQDPEENYLQTLSDRELEQMCNMRGFELVKETDKNGNPKQYSHDDYIDAATQCLEIETEMEQIISDNPQLLDDIEAEAQKMREENDKLEKELAMTKSKLRIEENPGDEQNIHVQGNDEYSPKINMDDNDEENEIIDLDIHTDNELLMTNHSVSDDVSTVIGNQDSSKGGDESLVDDQGKDNESIIDAGEIITEFRAKVKEDISAVVNIILPPHLREPLMNALKPPFRIFKNNVTTAFHLLKRYTLALLKNVSDINDHEENEGEDSSTVA